jgi:hypothetical protein
MKTITVSVPNDWTDVEAQRAVDNAISHRQDDDYRRSLQRRNERLQAALREHGIDPRGLSYDGAVAALAAEGVTF